MQLASSQISRFFQHSNATSAESQTIKPSENECDAIVDALKSRCDNDSSVASNQVSKKLANTQPVKKIKSVQSKEKPSNSNPMIKSFFTTETNDSLMDFETPNKIAKKVPKVLPTKVAKNARARRKQPDIRKALHKKATASENYSHLSEDDQLRLALEMSKADTSKPPIDLQAFEFRATNAKANSEFLDFFNMNRKAKKTRFKWNSKCTQLTRRNNDTEAAKVRDKIQEIIVNNIIIEANQANQNEVAEQRFDLADNQLFEIHSRRLQRMCMPQRILFELNSCEENVEDNRSSYYTNNLVEPSTLKAGVLLKDWSRIPGRDTIYDGNVKPTTVNQKTDDANVIMCDTQQSSPEYDIQTDSEEIVDKCDAQQDDLDKCSVGAATENQQMETAGCSTMNQASRASPMQIEMEHQADDSSDEDRTFVMDSDDIQLKVDAINTKIRLSQNYFDILQAPVLIQEAANVIRPPSPDLFDDDDDDECNMIDMTDEIRKNR